MESGSLILPIDSWQFVEFDKFSMHAGIDNAGLISQNALKQLDLKFDDRDNLAKFSQPTK